MFTKFRDENYSYDMQRLLTSPIGNSGFSPLILRVLLGVHFFIIALWGIYSIDTFQAALVEYAGSDSTAVWLLAGCSPYVLLVSSVLLIAGFLNNLACILMLSVFTILFLISGTFSLVGVDLPTYVEHRGTMKDLIIFGTLFSLLFSGPGAISFDNLFGRIYKGQAS